VSKTLLLVDKTCTHYIGDLDAKQTAIYKEGILVRFLHNG